MKVCSAAYMRALYHHYQNTSDEVVRSLFVYVQQELKPRVEAAYRALAAKALTWEPTSERYRRIVERLRVDAVTESGKLSELEAQVSKMGNAYTEIISNQRVVLDTPVTMHVLASMIESEPNREERRRLWLLRAARMIEDYDAIDGLFLEAVALRRQIARSAGAKNYLAYAWQSRYRTDYTPGDALGWLQDVRDVFSGAQERFTNLFMQRLEVDQLRPWDLDAIQTQGETRNRFSETSYLQAIEAAFRSLSPGFAAVVTEMVEKGHIDLINRPNKAGGNFATVLTPNSEPLVSCNGTGNLGDLRVMLHETGHAVHFAFASRSALSFEAFPRQEICEFAAYTFQTLASEQLVATGTITPDELEEFKLFILSSVLQKFRNIESTERFQHWLYTHEGILEAASLDEAWSRFYNDQGVDWTGHERYRDKGWQQSVVFSQPFYSIEYVISWIGTLLFISRFREDPVEMIARFERALTYGRKRTVQETFADLSIQFPFRRREIERAAAIFDQEFM